MTAFFLPIILVFGAFLRFYNNTAIALWHDEAFSALYVRYPFGEMMHRITLDVHPPLYYLILRVWTYFAGESLLTLRLLSILFGVLTIWAGYIFVKAAFANKRLALIASLLIAVNPFQIQYALEARMYTLGTFLILWSSYFLIRALNADGSVSGHEKKYWLFYSLTVAACLYTHYYLVFSVAAQGLYLLLDAFRHSKFKSLVFGLISYAIAFVLYLPWIPSLLQQIKRVESGYWIPPMNAWSIPGTIWKMIFGGVGVRNSILVVSSAITLFLLFYFLKLVRNFSKWLLIFGLVIPFVGAVVLSLKSNIYLDRYFVFASLYFSIFVGVAFYQIPNKIFRYSLIIILIGASLFSFFANWQKLDVKDKPGMVAAANVVNQNAKPTDKIYVASSFIFFTFKYYNATNITPLLISSSKLEDIPHFSGTALLSQSDLIMNFEQTKSGQTVWLISTTGFGSSKPQTPSKWKLLEEQTFKDVPDFKGQISVSKYQVN